MAVVAPLREMSECIDDSYVLKLWSGGGPLLSFVGLAMIALQKFSAVQGRLLG